MSKVKQHLATAVKLSIFSDNLIIAQFMCKDVNEINAILAEYPEPEFTYKFVMFDFVV